MGIPQQLSKAFEPQNLPQQLVKASRLLCHGASRGPTSCFYWASKLLRGTFSATSTSPGPTSCFSWASKLLRGTFWAPLKSFKSFKSPAAAFEGLWTAKPSAAACKGVPPALPWYLPKPHNLCGFYWASKLLRGAFSATSPGPTSCFSWASKLLRGTFWTSLRSLKSLKSPTAAFEGLWTAKPSAGVRHGPVPALCFAIVPPEAPQAGSIGLRSCYVARFQLPSQAPQAVSLGLRNCYVARFGYPLKASKASKAPQHPYPFSRGDLPKM